MDQPQRQYASRDPSTIGKISIDPAILAGKPRVAGTRISVEMILKELSGGLSIDQLLNGFPQLDRKDIQAALEYALHAIRREEVRPLPEVAG